MAICIPKSKAEELKAAMKAGDFSISDLYAMTSDERSTLLSSYVGKEFGHIINGRFEQAMISEQKSALAKWVEETFDPKQKVLKDTALEKISKMEDLLDPKEGSDFLKDLVAAKLKLTLTPEEGKGILDRAKKLEELAPHADAEGNATNVDQFGNPTLEYWQARRDMENYIQSLTPSPILQVFAQNIGRNFLLASLHTPIKAAIGDVTNTAFEAVARRLAGGQISSAVELGLQKAYVKKALEIYNKAGYNISTMMSLRDDNLFGEKRISAEGKGAFNATARAVTDIVINKLHGAPFALTESANFADSAALQATKVAKGEGFTGDALKARAKELFLDATSFDPKAEKAQGIRENAQAASKQATYTNKSWGANTSAYIKASFNKLLPGLGDWTIPIAKIPANVISRGVEVGGGGFVKAALELREAYDDFKSSGDKAGFKKPLKTLISMGLGLTIAYLIAANIGKDDFIGAYPTNANEVALLKARGGIADSIRIGNHWISLEYFGPLGPAITGFMYAKKYGDGTFKSYAEQYLGGLGSGVENLPGISQVRDAIAYIAESGQGGQKSIIDTAKAGNDLLTFAKGRTIPAFALDAFKVFGPASDVTNNFGAQKEKPAAWQQFLFGSAVAKSNQGPILDELTRLSDTSNPTTGAPNLPSLSDIEKYPKTAVLQSVLPPAKFTEAIGQFKVGFRIAVGQLIDNQYKAPATPTKPARILDYKSATDAQKAAMINQVKANTLDAIFKAYGQNPKMTATGKNIFEGPTTKAGDPTIDNLSKEHSDDGAIGRKTATGEPIYDRFSLNDSEPIVKELYAKDSYWKDNGYALTDVQLDHIVPVSAGGTNTRDNLELINKVSNALNHPFELYVVEKYKNGTMTRAQVIKASIDYKIKKSVSLTDIKNGKY